MSKLFQTLDPSLTPDQNVQRLKSGGWVKGSEMTQDQYDMIRAGPQGGRVRLTEFYGGTEWWQGGLRDGSSYHLSEWTLRRVHGDLADYYFIPYEDYRDGNLPPEPAQR